MINSFILFLDIDGVLNTTHYLKYGDDSEDPDGLTSDQAQIDPKKVELLNKIVLTTGCDVVISSSWRLTNKLADIREILKSRGFQGRIVDTTPFLSGPIRGDEIQAWLNKHAELGSKVKSFVILEDEEAMGLLESRTVRTTTDRGLTEHHANRAIQLFFGDIMSNVTIKVKWEDDEDCEEETELPAKYEVCPTCLGKGTHVNPNIDGHGISQEEWEHEWDEESKEMYLYGGYDVQCRKCDGLRVILEIDEELIYNYGTDEQRKALQWHHKSLKEEADYRRMVAAEIAYGC